MSVWKWRLVRVLGLGSATVLVVLGAMAIVGNSHCTPVPPTRWHGINPAVSTCQPDVSVWLHDRTTCISAGTFYTCLLNREQRMYECAPGLAQAEAP